MEEIRRLRALDDAAATRLEARLRAIFPDVKAGDRLTGVRVPGQGARFYSGERYVGRLDDEALADAFFAIWLDPRTRAPDLRRKLLGAQ